MFLYFDVDGIVPDMLQSSAAMMDSSRVSKYAQMTKNSNLDIFMDQNQSVKALRFFEVPWKHYIENIKQRGKSTRKCFDLTPSFATIFLMQAGSHDDNNKHTNHVAIPGTCRSIFIPG